MKCDILSLELYSMGRDIDIVEPILSYLELEKNLIIVRESIFNYEYKLLKYSPKVLVISNAVGSEYKFNAVKLAHMLGIKIVAATSEGGYACYNYNVVLSEKTYWGLNKDKIIYEDYSLQWNRLDLEMAKKYIPKNQHDKIKVSGGTGFDKYRIFSSRDKIELLGKYNKQQFKKVITIATWSFSLLYGEFFERNSQAMIDFCGGKEFVKLHRKTRGVLQEIYKKVIEQNRDILFIIKQHPAERDCPYPCNTEYDGLKEYDNVLFILDYQENIFNLIQVSDLLFAYESTTAMEAWLSNTPAIFVNPFGGDFPRLLFYKGVAIAKEFEELQKYIKEFYETGNIKEFADKTSARKDINSKIIEWDDGKNHIRAAKYIYSLYTDKVDKKQKINIWVCKMILKGILKRIFCYRPSMDIFKKEERVSEHRKYKEALVQFYKKNGMNI